MTVMIERIEPPHWWIGMKNRNLVLLVHGENIARCSVKLNHAAGIQLKHFQSLDNPNYLFLHLYVPATAEACTVEFAFYAPSSVVTTRAYEFRERDPGSASRQGIGPEDAIYLVVPDRFTDGTGVIHAPGMKHDTSAGAIVDRSNPDARHGGTLGHVRNGLDYIHDLGFTTLWCTPVVENDNARCSYHGYATTDMYRIDPRLGTHMDYCLLSRECRQRGMGLMMDIVLNHIGAGHWWMTDAPSADWINPYIPTNHARLTLRDPYASEHDRNAFSRGWFDVDMPDLNQEIALLSAYLVQNALWWIEETEIVGMRVDTYSYSDPEFVREWSRRIMEEYPHFTIVGEEWSNSVAVVANWQGRASHANSMMDFPLYEALRTTFTRDRDRHDRDHSFMSLYNTLGYDDEYEQAGRLVLFEGNHDTPRLFSSAHGDMDLFRMALAYVAVAPRIPQIMYGTEFAFKSPLSRADGVVRADFFPQTDIVKMTAAEQDVHQFVKHLFTWRRRTPCIHVGRTKHFIPDDAEKVYVLFRFTATDAKTKAKRQAVMLVMNKAAEERIIDTRRFDEVLHPFGAAHNVLTGETLTRAQFYPSIRIAARGLLLLVL